VVVSTSGFLNFCCFKFLQFLWNLRGRKLAAPGENVLLLVSKGELLLWLVAADLGGAPFRRIKALVQWIAGFHSAGALAGLR
jgi:hypothetical protein